MIDWFINAVQTNEFMQAAIVAAPVSVLTYTARNVPVKIWDTIRFFFSYDVVFRSDQDCYYLVNKLVRDKVISRKWSRDFTYDVSGKWDHNIGDEQIDYADMSIGYGKHWGKYNGQPVIVWRELEESNQTAEFKEILTLRFIGRNSQTADAFGREVTEMMEKRDQSERIQIRNSSHGGWLQGPQLSRRSMSTVFTSQGQGQKAIDFLRAFESSKEATLSKGLPWRTGILLVGPPGTGKTSFIHALASELGRDIRFLNLSAIETDREVTQLMSCEARWEQSMLVLEDIDVARVAVDREQESETVSLSTMLNVLDGFLTPEGLVTIATTNHPERLDPALTRPGRFDLRLDLGPLEWEEAAQMAELLLGKDNQFGTNKDSYVPIVGAELREQLMRA